MSWLLRVTFPGDSLLEDVQAAESLLQRVVDWDGNFTEGRGLVCPICRANVLWTRAGHFAANLVHVQRGVNQRLDGLRQQLLVCGAGFHLQQKHEKHVSSCIK